MKTFRISYTVIEGEHGCYDEFFVSAEQMSHERAVQEIADAWPATPEARELFRNELLTDDFGFIPDDVRAVKDVFWEEIKPVIITVRGGVIQDIADIPEGVQIKVVDWDTDELDEHGNPHPSVGYWDSRESAPAADGG